MASTIVPLDSNDEVYEVRTELDGAFYLITMRYNTRDGFWYMDLADDESTPIIQGIKVVLGWDLLFAVPVANRPPGSLIVVDLENSGVEAGRDDLGDRVRILYVS